MKRRLLYLLVIAAAGAVEFLAQWAREWATERMKEKRDG